MTTKTIAGILVAFAVMVGLVAPPAPALDGAVVIAYVD